MSMASLANWWTTTPTTELIWIIIGFIAQFLFSMRFIVQWLATEKARAPFRRHSGISAWPAARCCLPTPSIEWTQFSSSARRRALVIYARNIYFIWLGKREPSPAEIV